MPRFSPNDRLPRIRGTQTGLSNPNQVDQIKADMRSGDYKFNELRGRISGVTDPHGTYYVMVGHHRMVAALELYAETGEPDFVFTLLEWGFWDDVVRVPINSRPMPARNWWGALRNRWGF
ncbi:MAG: hypothetical protein K2R98_10035 [Gemmataceae bacterium]|nr:hypothetical protein [Gemmataceae bacterium]